MLVLISTKTKEFFKIITTPTPLLSLSLPIILYPKHSINLIFFKIDLIIVYETFNKTFF